MFLLSKMASDGFAAASYTHTCASSVGFCGKHLSSMELTGQHVAELTVQFPELGVIIMTSFYSILFSPIIL